jgi:hypothetical protein
MEKMSKKQLVERRYPAIFEVRPLLERMITDMLIQKPTQTVESLH